METVALILSCITLLISAITVFMLVLAYREQKRPADIRLVYKREDHTNEDIVCKSKLRDYLYDKADIAQNSKEYQDALRKGVDSSWGGKISAYMNLLTAIDNNKF